MENSLGAIFDEIPCTIVQGVLPNFGATFKIYKKSNLHQNLLKVSAQKKCMYVVMCIKKCNFW